MIRKIRVTLAIVSIILVTLLFLDFTGTAHAWFGWMAKIQFLPALLALNAAVIIALVIATLLLGRVYCSVICPLGIMQDGFAWARAQGEKEPLQLLSGFKLVALSDVRSHGGCHSYRNKYRCGSPCPL